MEITLGRPHSLQLGESSHDVTKLSVAKSRHTNKKRTVTRAPPFSTNRLSPISEESLDMMFNENDVKYEECCDIMAIKTDNETFLPRAYAEEQTKATPWDEILGEIDREIAHLRPPSSTSKNERKTAAPSESQAVLDESYEDLLSIEKLGLFNELFSILPGPPFCINSDGLEYGVST
uniref:INCENP_ARK-bind domain-containing protein n=1 Tax=Angiostrongylus cantonensis TaxID=6313 RepID=A0A0K0DPR3_ANGCA